MTNNINILDYFQDNTKGEIILPNVKKIFLPDERKEILDADLGGAEAMVYAWDSECKFLMDFFMNPKGKLYAFIASEHLQREITASSPEYTIYKSITHGSWFGLGLEKLCLMLRIPYTRGKVLKDWIDTKMPEKDRWHLRIKKEVQQNGFLTNKFGRRRWFLNKNDPTLYNKAYGFTSQSTIAEVINRAWINITDHLPEIEILLQVHDSLVMQYDVGLGEILRPKIMEEMKIPISYNPVLIIPSDFKVSTESYGACKKVKK
jgi:DNA polymerase I-like protein with 3'-5' exonuclease and polymerase domains